MGGWQRGEFAQQAVETLVLARFFGPLICGGAPGRCVRMPGHLTDERHGNRILKNGQHVFTALAKFKSGKKSVEKLWNEGVIVCFVTLNSGKTR